MGTYMPTHTWRGICEGAHMKGHIWRGTYMPTHTYLFSSTRIRFGVRNLLVPRGILISPLWSFCSFCVCINMHVSVCGVCMFVFICVRVCIYVCVCVYVYVCVYIQYVCICMCCKSLATRNISINPYLCVYVCMCVLCVRVCMCVYVYVRVYAICMHMYVLRIACDQKNIDKSICNSTCICVYVCMYVCMFVFFVGLCMCMYMYVYIRICTKSYNPQHMQINTSGLLHTYITYIHTYIHYLHVLWIVWFCTYTYIYIHIHAHTQTRHLVYYTHT
jgi:hypothetical protein